MNYRGRILRIIDANINRAKEGGRVCEDIMRLVINDKNSTLKLKRIRHGVSKIVKASKIRQYEIIQHRDSKSDVGKKVKIRNSRKRIADIFIANSQRIKEALRVLEELFCIFDNSACKKFQKLRFRFYNVEKDCFKKIRHLCNT
ncbi:MAG: thiamine-phosphate pyrophosphorylase [Candidatus Omnitrophica bacterium]|nr:thiamine-phosphate pyrophosphorylase [Candidatus Omnitrophota bacterium]